MQSEIDRVLEPIYKFLDRLSLNNSNYSRDEVIGLKELILSLKHDLNMQWMRHDPDSGRNQYIQPDVGETVHYMGDDGSRAAAAIITGLDAQSMKAWLTVFYGDHVTHLANVPYSSPHRRGHWSRMYHRA